MKIEFKIQSVENRYSVLNKKQEKEIKGQNLFNSYLNFSQKPKFNK